ncbi:hypothetical protein J2858_003608 [Neorhizobium galegae]|uniref:hypothetical protein n=1 Tax=Neorhizobium galegae TaxID=399 RepID=UPI001AEBA2E4|nr:hypothetical protein [Neorhizobium galegae]MBP2550668.1 hypothetical protein [Neorhizobium galegae]
MSEHLQEASSNGTLEVGGGQSNVGYKLVATREHDEAVRVRISVMAPRDWLLKQGFKHDATLVRKGGARLPIIFDGTLDVGDNISVELDASDTICPSIDEARKTFPELGLMAG